MGILRLSEKQTEAWIKLTDSETTEILYGGAAGGGKSYLGCIWHIDRRVRYSGTRGLIGRKELKSIKESTLITYLKVCRLMGYRAGIDFKYNAQDMVINWSNGSRTIFKELKQEPSDPNYESLGSTEFTDVFVDESGEIPEKAFEIINSRIRWMLPEYNLIPKILLTCNPNINWIKNKYIKNIKGEYVKLQPYQSYIRSTVDDNPDESFKALYKGNLSKLNHYDRARLLFGDWDAIPKTGGEFYKNFNSKYHIGSCEYNPKLPLHISFDENVNPYLPAIICQIDGKKLYVIDEIIGRDPHNKIKWVCAQIGFKYVAHASGMLIYGDATSQKEDVKQEIGHDLFKIILTELQKFRPSKRVNESNPSVIMRRNFIDEVFLNGHAGLSVEIDKNCTETIIDFEQTKEGSDGRKDKKTEKHPETGITYQPHGHLTDAFEYLFIYAFKNEYKLYQNGGVKGTFSTGIGQTGDAYKF